MEKKKPQSTAEKPVDASPAPEHTAQTQGEEEHKGGNYMFALKVLALLVVIILIIVVLQASGVPVAIRDWFRAFTETAGILPNTPVV